MRNFILLPLFIIVLASCNNNADTRATFCDTACKKDSFVFNGDHKVKPFVSVRVNNCNADTLSWSHEYLTTTQQMNLSRLFEQDIRLNSSAINCFIKDTAYAWLSFNDCFTGRGFLLKLPFSKKENIRKMSSALNSFDKKFVVPDDLRAFADYSTIYVIDVNTDKQEQMTFKEEYKIDWDNIHETIDSINVSRTKIFVKLIKNGEPVILEKQITL